MDNTLREVLDSAIDHALTSSADVRRTHVVLVSRGRSKGMSQDLADQIARAEIGRAIVWVLWRELDHPPRPIDLGYVLDRIRSGDDVAQVFQNDRR